MRFTLLFVLLINFFCHSQTVNGFVVSDKSNKALVYANITLLSKNKGSITNKDGYFTLNLRKEEFNDSLLFSYIGYKSKIISIQDLLNNPDSPVRLLEEVDNLKEVILSVKKAKYTASKTLGFNKRGIKQKISTAYGSEYATLIENDKFKDGKVTGVIFHLNKNKSDLFEIYPAYFRIKFYEYNNDLDMPGKLLSHENILIKPENKSQKYKLDVSQYNILMPKNGIVVGIEVINPNIELPKNNMYAISPTLTRTQTRKPMSWSSYLGKKWHLNKRKSRVNNKFYTSMYFNLTVEFRKG
ncbi:MAG: carboxypeptidase-like regulatory domain-containing protein [Oceanihabitans sp.]